MTPARSIAKHIDEIFSLAQPGEKIDIEKIVSAKTDEYPDDEVRPQRGRIASCLIRNAGEDGWGRSVRPHPRLIDQRIIVKSKPRNSVGVCKKCSEDIPSHHFELMNGIGERCLKFRVCQMCDFWYNALSWMYMGDETPEGSRALRIDGHHYTVESDDSAMKGFGGKSMPYILLAYPKLYGEDLVFECKNMWSQGKIPDAWSYQLPDNARFAHLQ